MLFGKKIRELRDENGVLQRQLAALLELPKNKSKNCKKVWRLLLIRKAPLLGTWGSHGGRDALPAWERVVPCVGAPLKEAL